MGSSQYLEVRPSISGVLLQELIDFKKITHTVDLSSKALLCKPCKMFSEKRHYFMGSLIIWHSGNGCQAFHDD